MKKNRCIGLMIILCAGMLTGCGSDLQADTNTVYVSKHGEVISIDVEKLDQPYYKEDELKNFVDSAVEEYNMKNGKDSVEVDELTVCDQTAKLRMKYKTTEDYTAFNGVELYQGKVVQAQADGYDFDTEFVNVTEDDFPEVSREEVMAQEDLKVVIVKADTNVKVDGKILYVTCDGVTVIGKNTVSIERGTGTSHAENTKDAGEPLSSDAYTYIIYK